MVKQVKWINGKRTVVWYEDKTDIAKAFEEKENQKRKQKQEYEKTISLIRLMNNTNSDSQ